VQTAVLIETLVDLGARRALGVVQLFSTQDHAAPAVAVGPTGTIDDPKGVASSHGRARRSEEYWVVHRAGAHVARWRGPNLLLMDGAPTRTLWCTRRAEFREGGHRCRRSTETGTPRSGA
jgi:adenosylhomocysteinase